MSPVPGDIAVSSFSSFHGRIPPSVAVDDAGAQSLNAALSPNMGRARVNGDDRENEEDLFALPMSPRSPDMKKSPFSLL
jgi:hypothetical protein